MELVPIVRPYVRTTCKEIQHKAFASYSQCYLEPYPDEPSICDLDLTDWAKVFWTIEGAFLETKIPSLKELMDSTRDCRNFVLGNIHDMRLIMLTFKKIGGHSVKKDPIETADTVTKQLAEQLLWKQHGVQWFSYVNDDTEQTDLNTRVGILLGSRSIYDVNAINTIGVPDADMDKTVDDFANAIGNEKLHLNISTDLSLVHFTACLDFDCQATYHDVTPKLSSGTANTKAHVVVIAILSSILMYLLIC